MLRQHPKSLRPIPTALLQRSRTSPVTSRSQSRHSRPRSPRSLRPGLTSTVQNDLITLKSDTDSFANALIAIVSADATDQAQAEKTTIDNDFQGAINEFANQLVVVQ